MTANLLIEIVVTLDKRPALFYRVLLPKVSDQALQDYGVPRCVRVSHSISKSLEESYKVLVILCYGWSVSIISFIQREVHIYYIAAFRPAGPELYVFTSILSQLSEEGDI